MHVDHVGVVDGLHDEVLLPQVIDLFGYAGQGRQEGFRTRREVFDALAIGRRTARTSRATQAAWRSAIGPKCWMYRVLIAATGSTIDTSVVPNFASITAPWPT